jgi:hypothetical protein
MISLHLIFFGRSPNVKASIIIMETVFFKNLKEIILKYFLLGQVPKGPLEQSAVI